MKKNIGTSDKVRRTLIAVTITILYTTDQITGGPGIVMVALAMILVITSFIGFCPLYLPFGFNSGAER